MTLEQYAYVGEIIAAIAVIASLVYIGSELRQNTEALQTQSRYNLINLRIGAMDIQLQNFELLDALHRYVDGEDLSAAERSAVNLHSMRLLEMWQWQHGEFQAGTLTLEQLPVESWRSFYHDNILPNALSEIWEMRRRTLRPDFVQFMVENVVNER